VTAALVTTLPVAVDVTWTPGDLPGQRGALLALLFDGLDDGLVDATTQRVPPVRPDAPTRCQLRKAAAGVIGGP
jgi:hypothetical protein